MTLRKVFHSSVFSCSHGVGAVIASGLGLVAVIMPEKTGREAVIAEARKTYSLEGENSLSRDAARLLERYFAGEQVEFSLPIDESGFTPFQCLVYREVAGIPRGEVRTYQQIAVAIGSPRGARGVGVAMARNPLPIIIPCHRVVGSNGMLTGYSAPGGLSAKHDFLVCEGVRIDPDGKVCLKTKK